MSLNIAYHVNIILPVVTKVTQIIKAHKPSIIRPQREGLTQSGDELYAVCSHLWKISEMQVYFFFLS